MVNLERVSCEEVSEKIAKCIICDGSEAVAADNSASSIKLKHFAFLNNWQNLLTSSMTELHCSNSARSIAKL